jgi:hypothetical protein
MESKEFKKIQFSKTKGIKDMTAWLWPNMFIGTQMTISSDTDGSFCIEAFRFLPEA